MRRLRRLQRKRDKAKSMMRHRAIVAGTSAIVALGAGSSISGTAAAASLTDKHQVVTGADADADLLTDGEELAIGYRAFRADQNDNIVADGADLAMRLAGAVAQLPDEEDVTSPDQIYKRQMTTFGEELCDVCGQTVNMGSVRIVNPRLNLEIEFPILALHYMEHGAFGYSGDVHKGRVDVPLLVRVLEIRFPEEVNDHQLPLDYSVEAGVPIAADANDLDGDVLADSEELAIAYNLYEVDQNANLRPDGVELAIRCAEIVESLPMYDVNSPDAKGIYKQDYMQRGLEWCDVCGESINMGFWRIMNSASGASLDLPEIALHYLQHGSFSHAGDVHVGRTEVAALVEILEMPRRCDDLGVAHPLGDLNGDCRIDLNDLAELANRWLASTDPETE